MRAFRYGRSSGPDTFLGMIAGIVLDPQHQEIYTANNDIEDTVVVMPYAGSGNAKPARVFSVPHQAWGLALSDAADQIAVTVEVQNTVAFYRRQVKGVEAPLRILRGQATGLADPHGIYWDDSHNEIGVANHGNFRGVVKNTGGGCSPSFVVEDEAEAGESRPPSIRIFAAKRKRRCEAAARDSGIPERASTGRWASPTIRNMTRSSSQIMATARF